MASSHCVSPAETPLSPPCVPCVRQGGENGKKENRDRWFLALPCPMFGTPVPPGVFSEIEPKAVSASRSAISAVHPGEKHCLTSMMQVRQISQWVVRMEVTCTVHYSTNSILPARNRCGTLHLTISYCDRYQTHVSRKRTGTGHDESRTLAGFSRCWGPHIGLCSELHLQEGSVRLQLRVRDLTACSVPANEAALQPSYLGISLDSYSALQDVSTSQETYVRKCILYVCIHCILCKQ